MTHSSPSWHICSLSDRKNIIKVINFKIRLLWIYVLEEKYFGNKFFRFRNAIYIKIYIVTNYFREIGNAI